MSIYKRTIAEFYSYTNPIWLKIASPTSNIDNTASCFSVYPNPAEDYFIIKLEDSTPNAILEIYNPEGKVVYQENVYDKQSINTEVFSPGVYFVNLQGIGNGQKTKLIIF